MHDKLSEPAPGFSFISDEKIWEWYQLSHLTLKFFPKCITIPLMLIHFYHPIFMPVFVESQALSGRNAQFLMASSYLLRLNDTLTDGNRGGGTLLYPSRIIRINLDTSVSVYLATFIWQIPGIPRQPSAHQPISQHHRSQSSVAAAGDHASNPGIMLGCKNRLLAWSQSLFVLKCCHIWDTAVLHNTWSRLNRST